MRVLEMYKCFQGEGINTGQASVLVRLFGCNLRCSWCDTDYSINQKLFDLRLLVDTSLSITETSFTDLAKTVSDFDLPVIVSGGEPLIHQDIEKFLRLLTFQYKRRVTVETNGTQFIGLIDPKRILWSLSPKLGGANTKPMALKTLSDFVHAAALEDSPSSVQLKFVLSDVDDDLNEVIGVIQVMPSLTSMQIPIILQPDGNLIRSGDYFDSMKRIEHAVMSTPILREVNVRVMPQLHALVHGQKVRLV